MARKSSTTPRIFLSYSHKDKKFGTAFAEHLRSTIGSKDAVWFDTGIRGGENWSEKIMRELSSSNIFIVLLSPNALKSRWVRTEIHIAWKRHLANRMLFMPVYYQPCKVPIDLAFIDTRQFISFLPPENYNKAFASLLEALNIKSNRSYEHISKPNDEDFNSIDPEIQKSIRLMNNLLNKSVHFAIKIVEEAYQTHDWFSVTRIANTVINYYPEAATNAIYEMRELAYLYSFSEKMSKSQYKLAQINLRKALGHIKDTRMRLDVLDAYVITLIEQGIQSEELVECIKEAIKLAPDKLYWKELQNSLPLKDMNKKHLPELLLPKEALALLPVVFFILPFLRYFIRKRAGRTG
jgi:tetratricopeptide (TPR) repeat protein